MLCSKSARAGTAVGAAITALAVVFGVSAMPAGAVPDPVPQTIAKTGRVMPLPQGKWSWSANYGVAGPMWASGHHTGQDFSAASGTPILAAADGIVVFAGVAGPYGNLTQIQHPDGVQTWYAHQSVIATHVGAAVKAGQTIGAVGATGNTTGPHLHFEVRLNGAHADPKAWLEGAPAVPGEGSLIIDPAQADQLRSDLAEADAALARADQEVAEINKQVAEVSKELAVADAQAQTARDALGRLVRNVYKTGIDPQWLLQSEAITSGDLSAYADRTAYLDYSSQAENQRVIEALAVLKRAQDLRDQVQALQAKAQSVRDAADLKQRDIQARLDASAGLGLIGTQFDGYVPPGGSEGALKAVKFALSQVGHPYAREGGTGPSYGCNGFAWRAWNEAGSKWPLQMANSQALNTKWVVPVAPGQEQPGDLIFWRMNNGTDLPGRIDHVGLVVNPIKGVFVHASSPRTGVEINNYRTSTYYRTPAMFGRVVDVAKKDAEKLKQFQKELKKQEKLKKREKLKEKQKKQTQ